MWGCSRWRCRIGQSWGVIHKSDEGALIHRSEGMKMRPQPVRRSVKAVVFNEERIA